MDNKYIFVINLITMYTGTGVLILAGGESQRMDQPKPFLKINGEIFLEKIVNGYLKAGIKTISIVLNYQLIMNIPENISKNKSVKVIPNFHPEQGRSYSILIGLKKYIDIDFVFIHNVDNPFVEKNILDKMCLKKISNGFVVPSFNRKGGHPVLISKKIILSILSRKKGFKPLNEILLNFKRVEVEMDSENILVNVNTWKEYEQLISNNTIPAEQKVC